MKDIEKLINRIMKEAEADGEPVTYEEAKEMAEMEIKASKIKNYVQSDKPKTKVKREVKMDANKVELITRIRNAFNVYTTVTGGVTDLIIANPQREITFTFDGDEYSITLTKHRTKKGG